MSANISPLSSKITLKQSTELMSQLYSPPVTFAFWPLKAFALGAPTSSLQRKHQWLCKDVWSSIKCTLWLSSISTHLHSCLLSCVPLIYYVMTHSSLLCNTAAIFRRMSATKLMFHVFTVQLSQRPLSNACCEHGSLSRSTRTQRLPLWSTDKGKCGTQGLAIGIQFPEFTLE